MRRSCKHIDVTDWRTVLPWVRECVGRHRKRYDFRHMMMHVGGLTMDEYYQACDGAAEPMDKAAENIAKEAARRIADRELNLSPVCIRLKEDHSTYKLRMIGRESAMQQIMDYIAVKGADDVFKRRIVPQQSSSIAGRGPVYGVDMISRWLRSDRRAAKWAKDRGKRYTRKCRYFVKLDIEKCYQSLRISPFIQRFSRDCGNEDLLWLWTEILESHHVKKPDGEMYEGFMIGALPSQQACQYILSFLYRYTMDLHKVRHGKTRQMVSHMTLFMDDMLLMSSSRSDLKEAVEDLTRYAKEEFGLTIKPEWQICDIDETPVDMMGYLIHADGNVTVRPRVFLRARRLALRVMRCRNRISLRQARRACSYKGYFRQKKNRIPLRSKMIYKKLNLRILFGKSAEVVSRYERRKAHENREQRGAGQNPVYAPA